ncbi:MAG: hypothetical protein ABI878_16260 [Acidobacteriota bacterium]
MKTLICAMFLSLLWVSPAFSQEGRPFYNVCKSDADLIGDFQRESITVKTLDSDSLVFVSAGTTYSGKTSSGSDLLVGGKGGAAFYARKVDNNSFLIASGESGSFSDYGAFVYYHADKSKADQSDDKRQCSFHPLANLSSFQTSVRSFEKTKGSNEKIVFDAQTKGVITSWTKNYTSRRVDPALERGIVKWWKGPDPTKIPDPILHIYFLEPNYEIARNAFGEVLRKTVDALILWKERTGSKCYIQWRSFGYESLGGGTFSTEMEMWTLDRDIPMAGGRKILAGSWYAVDCAPFVK